MTVNVLFCVIFAISIFIEICLCAVSPPFTSCNITDEDCLSDIFNTALTDIVTRNNDFGLENSDPMFLEEIIGDFPTLYYINTNNTVTGIKEWRIRNVSLSLDLKAVQFVIDVPGFRLEGITRFEGYFLALPVLGLGPYVIDYGKYEISVYSLISLDVSEDGGVFARFGEYYLNPKPLSPTNYNYSLIFSESDEITPIGNEIQSETWEESAIFSRRPVIYPIVGRLLSRMNDYFEFVA